MKKLEERVELAGSCYYNMIRSLVESYSRESTGDLIGKKHKNRFIMLNSYPILTAKRKPTEVSYENKEAINRLKRMDKALNKLGGLGNRTIGGYHCHFYKEDEIREGLKKGDREFIKDELSESKRKYWIEVLLTAKARKYEKPKETGEFFIAYKKKLRVILRDIPFHAYDIIISAYKVDENSRIKELKVCQRKVKVKPNSSPKI